MAGVLRASNVIKGRDHRSISGAAISIRQVLLLLFAAIIFNLSKRTFNMLCELDIQQEDFPLAPVVNRPSWSRANSFNETQAQRFVREGVKSIYHIPEIDDFKYHGSSSSPVSSLLRIYVYDNLPDVISKDVEDYLYKKYLTNGSSESELVWIRLFRSYPNRTRNPKEADVFVVPYSHKGHCSMTPGWVPLCGHIPVHYTRKWMRQHLKYYRRNRERHLFMAASDTHFSHAFIMAQPLLLATGPLKKNHHQPGFIVMSQFNDLPSFQPSVLLNRTIDWWTRPRRYSFVEFSGKNNTRMGRSPRKFRFAFSQEMKRAYPEVGRGEQLLGGLPFEIVNFDEGTNYSRAQIYEMYQDSVFCPVLSGDAPWQRRFFDVILSGCLPVVLKWDVPYHRGGKSWRHPNQRPIRPYTVYESIPYPKGKFGGDSSIEVDYESFVVECPGNVTDMLNVSILRTTMEDLLLHRPDEIRQRQLNLRKYMMAFSFGLGQDAHRYEDGFARVIRTIRYYLDNNVTSPVRVR